MLLIALLLTKHFLADFPWQTQWMVREKATSLTALVSHGLVHALLTLLVILAVTGTWRPDIALWELLAHCAIDAIKAQSRRPPSDPRFWTLLGLDQWAHHMTYVGIALYLGAS